MNQTIIVSPDANTTNSWLESLSRFGIGNSAVVQINKVDTPPQCLEPEESDETDVNKVISDMLANGYVHSWCIHKGKGMFKFTKVEKNTLTTKERELGLTLSTVVLFRDLKKWRLETSKVKNVSAYIIFYDAVLVDITKALPTTLDQFRFIKGVGPKKATDYGDQIVQLVLEYMGSKPVEEIYWYNPASKMLYSS
jgi:superfamily II DNA helicase RecQ